MKSPRFAGERWWGGYIIRPEEAMYEAARLQIIALERHRSAS